MKKVLLVVLILVLLASAPCSSLALGKEDALDGVLEMTETAWTCMPSPFYLQYYGLAKVTNTSDIALHLHGIGEFTLKDADGNTVITEGYPWVLKQHLEPGESTYARFSASCFDISAPQTGLTCSMEVWPVAATSHYMNYTFLPCAVSYDTETGDFLMEVTNDTAQSLPVHSYFVLRDTAGNLLHILEGKSEETDPLTPGASRAFTAYQTMETPDFLASHNVDTVNIEGFACFADWADK